MAGDDGRCGVAVAVVLCAGRQNNQDFSAKITKICVRYERRFARFLLRLPPWPPLEKAAPGFWLFSLLRGGRTRLARVWSLVA